MDPGRCYELRQGNRNDSDRLSSSQLLSGSPQAGRGHAAGGMVPVERRRPLRASHGATAAIDATGKQYKSPRTCDGLGAMAAERRGGGLSLARLAALCRPLGAAADHGRQG